MPSEQAQAVAEMKVTERAFLVRTVGLDALTTSTDDLEQWDAVSVLTANDQSLKYLDDDDVIHRIETGDIKIVPATAPLTEEIRAEASFDPQPPFYAHYTGQFEDDGDGDWLVYPPG